MKPWRWWRWWRMLPHNPVYLREKGGWGNPNPFYASLMRYSPFVVFSAILLGLCAGSSNPTFLGGNDATIAAACLVCIPSFLLSAVTLYGAFIAPALTAPAISMEMNRGTWEILRSTPIPMHTLVGAKLFGSLARLRIWPVLFALTLLQGLLTTCVLSFLGEELAVLGAPIGGAVFLRPWLEVIYAALAGMYLSVRTASATTALVGAYVAVVAMKLFNNSGVWLGVASLLSWNALWRVAASSMGPTAVYTLALVALTFGLVRTANRIEFA